MKAGLKISRTLPLASYLDENDTHAELDHSLHLRSDAELALIARERVETLYHPACSCRMAPLEDGGVVDSQFRVHGILNLRVCDASTFPMLVSGHTVSLHFHIGVVLIYVMPGCCMYGRS
jgi:choline dehydrogenase